MQDGILHCPVCSYTCLASIYCQGHANDRLQRAQADTYRSTADRNTTFVEVEYILKVWNCSTAEEYAVNTARTSCACLRYANIVLQLPWLDAVRCAGPGRTEAASLDDRGLRLIQGFHLYVYTWVYVCVRNAPVLWGSFKRGTSVCSSSRQQVGGFKQSRPHANSLSRRLSEHNSNNPSSGRTFLCHCGCAGGSSRAGMLPSHYRTEMDSVCRQRWDRGLALWIFFFWSLIISQVLEKKGKTTVLGKHVSLIKQQMGKYLWPKLLLSLQLTLTWQTSYV